MNIKKYFRRVIINIIAIGHFESLNNKLIFRLAANFDVKLSYGSCKAILKTLKILNTLHAVYRFDIKITPLKLSNKISAVNKAMITTSKISEQDKPMF